MPGASNNNNTDPVIAVNLEGNSKQELSQTEPAQTYLENIPSNGRHKTISPSDESKVTNATIPPRCHSEEAYAPSHSMSPSYENINLYHQGVRNQLRDTPRALRMKT